MLVEARRQEAQDPNRRPTPALGRARRPARRRSMRRLTKPPPPSAALLDELEGEQPAAQRSRLPARSAGAMLNEHLAHRRRARRLAALRDHRRRQGDQVGPKKAAAASSVDASSDASSDDDDDDDGPEMILHEEKEQDQGARPVLPLPALGRLGVGADGVRPLEEQSTAAPAARREGAARRRGTPHGQGEKQCVGSTTAAQSA